MTKGSRYPAQVLTAALVVVLTLLAAGALVPAQADASRRCSYGTGAQGPQVRNLMASGPTCRSARKVVTAVRDAEDWRGAYSWRHLGLRRILARPRLRRRRLPEGPPVALHVPAARLRGARPPQVRPGFLPQPAALRRDARTWRMAGQLPTPRKMTICSGALSARSGLVNLDDKPPGMSKREAAELAVRVRAEGTGMNAASTAARGSLAGMVDADELALLEQSQRDHSVLEVIVNGCAHSCCGRGWQRRDGYEQTYYGYVDNLKLPERRGRHLHALQHGPRRQPGLRHRRALRRGRSDRDARAVAAGRLTGSWRWAPCVG